MLLSKPKSIIAMLLIAAFALTGVVSVGRSALGDDKSQPAKQNHPATEEGKPSQTPQGTDKSAMLLKARLDFAQKAYSGAWEGVATVRRLGNALIPVDSPEEVYTWSVRLLNAQCDLCSKSNERLEAIEEHVERMKKLKTRVSAMTPDLLPSWQASAASWYLTTAELWQAKEKAIQREDADVPMALFKSRLDAANKAYQGALEDLEAVKTVGNVVIPKAYPEEVYTWSIRWLYAQLDMSDKQHEHIAALKKHIERMNELVDKVTALTPELFPSWLSSATEWYLTEAEIWLAKEKANQKADFRVSKALLTARHDAAQVACTIPVEGFCTRIRRGDIVSTIRQKRMFVDVYTWPDRWLNAQLGTSDKRNDRIAVGESHIKHLKELQRKVNALSPDYLPEWTNSAAEWYLVEAELLLEREKAR